MKNFQSKNFLTGLVLMVVCWVNADLKPFTIDDIFDKKNLNYVYDGEGERQQQLEFPMSSIFWLSGILKDMYNLRYKENNQKKKNKPQYKYESETVKLVNEIFHMIGPQISVTTLQSNAASNLSFREIGLINGAVSELVASKLSKPEDEVSPSLEKVIVDKIRRLSEGKRSKYTILKIKEEDINNLKNKEEDSKKLREKKTKTKTKLKEQIKNKEKWLKKEKGTKDEIEKARKNIEEWTAKIENLEKPESLCQETSTINISKLMQYTVKIKNMNGVEKDETFSISPLIETIEKSISEQTFNNGIYPPYITNLILALFAYKKGNSENTTKDCDDYYEGLEDAGFKVGFSDESEREEEFKKSQKLKEKIQERFFTGGLPATVDWTYCDYKYANDKNESADGNKSFNFPDCMESTVRSFINIVMYDDTKASFNYDDKLTSSDGKSLNPLEEFKDFYKKYASPTQSGEKDAHKDWAELVENEDFVAYYQACKPGKTTLETKIGDIPFIRLTEEFENEEIKSNQAKKIKKIGEAETKKGIKYQQIEIGGIKYNQILDKEVVLFGLLPSVRNLIVLTNYLLGLGLGKEINKYIFFKEESLLNEEEENFLAFINKFFDKCGFSLNSTIYLNADYQKTQEINLNLKKGEEKVCITLMIGHAFVENKTESISEKERECLVAKFQDSLAKLEEGPSFVSNLADIFLSKTQIKNNPLVFFNFENKPWWKNKFAALLVLETPLIINMLLDVKEEKLEENMKLFGKTLLFNWSSEKDSDWDTIIQNNTLEKGLVSKFDITNKNNELVYILVNIAAKGFKSNNETIQKASSFLFKDLVEKGYEEAFEKATEAAKESFQSNFYISIMLFGDLFEKGYKKAFEEAIKTAQKGLISNVSQEKGASSILFKIMLNKNRKKFNKIADKEIKIKLKNEGLIKE